MTHAEAAMIKFHAELLEADRRAAARVRERGCKHCGGRLDAANYPRKARGLATEQEDAGQYGWRFSLCCAGEGCRRRATPPSLRFLGRKIYGGIVVLVTTLRRGLGIFDAIAPRAAHAPSWATRRRWRSWWTSGLISSAWFAELVARLTTSAAFDRAPDSVFDRFEGTDLERCVHVLRFISPLTTHSVTPDESRCSMAR